VKATGIVIGSGGKFSVKEGIIESENARELVFISIVVCKERVVQLIEHLI